MIHDNNYAAGKTSAHDLRTVHDMGKSLPWIHYGRNMTNPRQFHTDTHQNICLWSDDWIYMFTYLGEASVPLTG